MPIIIGTGINIGGGINFGGGAASGGGGGSTYPTVSAANEVFKFNYNTLAATPDNIAEISSHAWPAGDARGSGGYAGLSQPSGGAYSDSGYYFNNDGSTNQGWLTALGGNGTVSNYATYHNANVAQASWAFETNVWIYDVGSYNINSGLNLLNLYPGGLTILQQNNSSTKYQIGLAFATGPSTGSANNIYVACNDLTGGAWKHVVVQVVRSSVGNGRIYCYVNGVLQNSGGTPYTFGGCDFYCEPISGAQLGGALNYSAPRLGYRLDNTRLVLGASFPLSGFTAPTSAFTA